MPGRPARRGREVPPWCDAYRQDGTPCQTRARLGSRLCHYHSEQDAADFALELETKIGDGQIGTVDRFVRVPVVDNFESMTREQRLGFLEWLGRAYPALLTNATR